MIFDNKVICLNCSKNCAVQNDRTFLYLPFLKVISRVQTSLNREKLLEQLIE